MYRESGICLKKLISNNRIDTIQLRKSSKTASSSAAIQNENSFENMWKKSKPASTIPGPNIIQMLLRFLPGGKYHNIELLEMHRKIRSEYGQIAKLPGLLGNKGIILIYDADDFEQMFRNEGIWPNRRGIATFDIYRKKVRPEIFKNLGGLITDQGESWSRTRSIVSPILLKPSIVNAYIPLVDGIANEFVTRIKSLRDENFETPANFGCELNKWALESISAIALDQRLNIMSDEDNVTNSKSRELIEAVDEFFRLSFELELKPSLWRYFETPKYKQLMKCFDKMTYATLYYIDQAIEKLEKNPSSPISTKEPSVLEKLLKIDKHVAVIMALDMLMAGVDTTSSSMANILYFLGKNPDKQAKLREELKAVLPDLNGKLKSSSFLNIPYLRATIKEVLRLAPITPGNARAAEKDLIIKGYQIPKFTDVAMTNMLLSNDEKYFKDPEKFIPERWLKDGMADACPEAKSSNPFVYLPFGHGPRACVGRRFAEMELNVLVTRLVCQFHIEFNHPRPKYRHSFVSSPIGDLKYKLIEI